MYVKTIEYKKPLTGETASEKFYFNLTKQEVIDLEMLRHGGLSDALQTISMAKNNVAIVEEFKNIIRMSYGEVDADGVHFRKFDPDGRPLWRNFEQHPAYSELYIELLGSPTAAAEFVNGIMPEDVQDLEAMKKLMAADSTEEVLSIVDTLKQ